MEEVFEEEQFQQEQPQQEAAEGLFGPENHQEEDPFEFQDQEEQYAWDSEAVFDEGSKPHHAPELETVLEEGQKIGDGRYVLQVSIGKGGFGEVFKAHDTFQGIDVAVKMETKKDSKRVRKSSLMYCKDSSKANLDYNPPPCITSLKMATNF